MAKTKKPAKTSKPRTKKKSVASKAVKRTSTKRTPSKRTPAKPAAKRKKVPAAAKAATSTVAARPEGIFAQMAALREEMDNLFSSMTQGMGFPEFRIPTIERTSLPSLADVRFEVSETDKALEVKAEVPGLTEDDLQLELSNGMLTIKGRKKEDKEEKKKDFYVRECRYGSFSRSFRVPDSVLEDQINANLEKGVLSIVLPKRAASKRGARAIKVSQKS